MNLHANSRIRFWLMGAATAGVLGPALTLGQSNESSSPAENQRPSSTNRQVVRTARQPSPGFITPAGFQVTDGGMVVAESEIEYQLRLLYERDGREMPNMRFADPQPQSPVQEPANSPSAPAQPMAAPKSQPPAQQQITQPAVRPALPQLPATPPRKPPVPHNQAEPAHTGPNKISSFFKKMVPGGNKKAPHQIATVPPRQSAPTGTMPPAALNKRTAQSVPALSKSAPPKPARQPIAAAPQQRAVPSQVTQPAPSTRSAASLAQAPQAESFTPANEAGPLATITPSAPNAAPIDSPVPVGETPAEITTTTTASSESLASFIPPSPAPLLEAAPPASNVANSPVPEAAVQFAPAEVATSNPPVQNPPESIEDFPDPFPQEPSEDELFEQPLVQSPAQPTETPAQSVEAPFATTQPVTLDAQPQDPAEEPAEESFEPPIINPYSGKSLEESAAVQSLEQSTSAAAAQLASPQLPPAKIEQASADDNSVAAKMRRVIQRADMKGLKGFCPVTLRDQRELADSVPEFVSSYRGQKFYFASQPALIKFDLHPERYAPAAYGADVVVLTRDQDVSEGTLDHSAWYRGRLYLFASRENHDLFVKNPETYASPPGIE